MSDFAIQVENLSKRYRISRKTRPAQKMRGQGFLQSFEYLASTLRKPTEDETLWALREVSCNVTHGEVLGLIGRNGAGKTTLLKILSRITEPTGGRAVLNGRVGSLLEVGTGFHPELTGRENIYLSGAILGMKRAEIDRKFDEIVAFAGTEKFIDTPVKRYSSGMYVRLAFSVAAHLEPEILLVDEVLAVGDAAFQKKCLDKMGNVASQGRTVLFVSHNMVAVQNLCGRAILLDEGKILEEGDTARVVSNYLARSYSPLTEQIWPDVHIAPGNEQVRLRRLCIRPEHGLSGDPISHETSFVVEVEYWNLVPGAVIYPCLHFYTEQQIIAFTSAPIDYDLSEEKPKPKGLYKSICHVPDNFLNSGAHRVLLLMIRDTSRILYKFENALSFEILDLGTRPGSWYGKEPGIVRPKMQWETNSPQ